MSVISIILVLLVAFLAGMEGILDEFQFHQPLVACTLIGLVTGNLEAGIVLGGTLQMIALGWANIGAAVAPDAALASVASAIILVLGGQGVKGVPSAIAIAVPLAVAGLFLTMIVRTVAVPIVHMMDAAAEKGNIKQVEMLHIFAVCLQGIRIAIPAGALLFIPADTVRNFLESMPAWLTDGMAIGGRCRRLCISNQHDGNKRSMAILHYRFRSRSDFSININRIRCFRCRFSSYLLELI